MGVNAQKVEEFFAWSIRGSGWNGCVCIFGAMKKEPGLLALGVNRCAGAQKLHAIASKQVSGFRFKVSGWRPWPAKAG
jgi:hypothetical protein